MQADPRLLKLISYNTKISENMRNSFIIVASSEVLA